jgi:hypothetical protein
VGHTHAARAVLLCARRCHAAAAGGGRGRHSDLAIKYSVGASAHCASARRGTRRYRAPSFTFKLVLTLAPLSLYLYSV